MYILHMCIIICMYMNTYTPIHFNQILINRAFIMAFNKKTYKQMDNLAPDIHTSLPIK